MKKIENAEKKELKNKNTPEIQEKYSGKLGEILQKIRIPESKSLFPTMYIYEVLFGRPRLEK